MDQTLKGMLVNVRKPRKYREKNCSFGIPCFYSTHGLVKGVWIASRRILNKTTTELSFQPTGKTARVTCHLNCRTTIKPCVCDRESIIQTDVSWNNSVSTISILEDNTHITGHCPSFAEPFFFILIPTKSKQMSKEILVTRMGKQTTVFYYNVLQAAYRSKNFGNTKVFPKYLRCTNKTLHSPVPFALTDIHGGPSCGQNRASSTSLEI